VPPGAGFLFRTGYNTIIINILCIDVSSQGTQIPYKIQVFINTVFKYAYFKNQNKIKACRNGLNRDE